MAKTRSNGSLPEMGASCVEEPPICVSRAIALEDKEAGLLFGAIFDREISVKDDENGKKL